MDARMLHLLVRLRRRFGPDVDAGEVAAYLAEEGFDSKQIGAIVTAWRGDSSPRDWLDVHDGMAPMSIRVLGSHEEGRFTPEAWGHLLMLRASGILGSDELEI